MKTWSDKKLLIWSIVLLFLFWPLGLGMLIYYFSRRSKRQVQLTDAHSAGGLITEDFKVVGSAYYVVNINKLAMKNDKWSWTAAQAVSNGMTSRKIYRYTYINKPVKLIFEPSNPHDKNAIAVQIAGEIVGYISRSDNLHVADVLKKQDVKYISGFIGGGEYKIALDSKGFTRNTDSIYINIRIAYY